MSAQNKKLDLVDPKNFTYARVMGRVCEGLAEVCEMIYQDPQFMHANGRRLKELRSEFAAFGRWWLRQADINDRK